MTSDPPIPDREKYTIVEDDMPCPVCKGAGRVRIPRSECDVMTVLRKDWDYMNNFGNKYFDDCERFIKHIIKLAGLIKKHGIESDLADDIVKDIEAWAEESVDDV